MRAAFDALDKDGSGTIDREELSQVLGGADIGESFDRTAGEDQMIDFDEFRELMRARMATPGANH